MNNGDNHKKENGLGSVFKRHLLLLVLSYIAAVLVTYLVYLIVPKYYKAYATVLQPPERPGSLDAAKGARFSEGIQSNIRTNTELFFSILGSRRMKDDLIEKFGLFRTYNVRNMDEAREVMTRRMTVSLAPNKVLAIEVIDTSPERAAAMADFSVRNLETLIHEMAITTARQNRVFIEKRLDETTQLIGQLEQRLQYLQNRHKYVADKELDQITQMGGQIMQRLINKQLELEKKKQYLSDTEPEIIMIRNEIADLKKSLAELLDSQDELTRVLRELKVQESVYSYLTAQLEEAKLNETKDTPIVQVLDKPVIPDKVFRPDLKFLMILIVSVMGGITFLTIFFDVLRFLGSI